MRSFLLASEDLLCLWYNNHESHNNWTNWLKAGSLSSFSRVHRAMHLSTSFWQFLSRVHPVAEGDQDASWMVENVSKDSAGNEGRCMLWILSQTYWREFDIASHTKDSGWGKLTRCRKQIGAWPARCGHYNRRRDLQSRIVKLERCTSVSKQLLIRGSTDLVWRQLRKSIRRSNHPQKIIEQDPQRPSHPLRQQWEISLLRWEAADRDHHSPQGRSQNREDKYQKQWNLLFHCEVIHTRWSIRSQWRWGLARRRRHLV